MKTVDQYLDKAKEITGSDYRTAQVLGMTRAAISNVRKSGKIGNDNAVKLAELIEENPFFIIAASDIKTHPKNEKTWQKWKAENERNTKLRRRQSALIDQGTVGNLIVKCGAINAHTAKSIGNI